MDNAALLALVLEAAPLDDAIAEVTQPAGSDTLVTIRFGAVDVLVENLPEFDKIGFSALISGPADRHLMVYRTLLAGNALWRSNGGVRYAIAGDGTDIEISVDLPVSKALPATVAALARGLAEIAATWIMVFDGQVAPEMATGSALDFDANLLRL